MSQQFISLTADQTSSQEEEHHGHSQGRRGSTHEPLAQHTTTPNQGATAKDSSDEAEVASDRLNVQKPVTTNLP
ncbi:hypothetical protein INT43_006610 [Umbelopsis isabellina]|uniref:Uncharacterized protein n=1 Tax=Mortierella isabellina TaxID=91625 RepID=A0A8H7Q213_MORIS|nr:hypothetical protein INT43_006610 [Umbelopsis isabellina]